MDAGPLFAAIAAVSSVPCHPATYQPHHQPHLHLWRPRSIVSFPSLEVVSTRVVFTDSLAPSPRLPLSLASSDAAGSPLLHHGRKWPRWSIAAIAAGVGITYASNPDATSHCWPCCRLPLVRPGPVCPFREAPSPAPPQGAGTACWSRPLPARDTTPLPQPQHRQPPYNNTAATALLEASSHGGDARPASWSRASSEKKRQR